MSAQTTIAGGWVILGHGRPVDDVYQGPADYSSMSQACFEWNEFQTAREQRGEAPRGSLQRFYIKRV